jgi:hypothetical protein
MVNSPTFVGRARRSESRFHNDFAARRGLGRLKRFRGVGSLCDHLGGFSRATSLAVTCDGAFRRSLGLRSTDLRLIRDAVMEFCKRHDKKNERVPEHHTSRHSSLSFCFGNAT